jgi:hypothetical protein
VLSAHRVEEDPAGSGAGTYARRIISRPEKKEVLY